jgi:hypothetical protein
MSVWRTFTQLLWPESPQEQTQTSIAHLTDEMARRYRRLIERQQRIEEIRARLIRQEHERTVPPLTSDDRLFKAIERNRLKLAEHEARYARQRRGYLRCKQLRQALLRGQVIVRPQPDPQP